MTSILNGGRAQPCDWGPSKHVGRFRTRVRLGTSLPGKHPLGSALSTGTEPLIPPREQGRDHLDLL